MYGLTLSLKNEIVKVAPRGRVNTVAPGWVRTVRTLSYFICIMDSSSRLHIADGRARLAKSRYYIHGFGNVSDIFIQRTGINNPRSTPLKKIAEPIDVANQIIVLASSKISGHVSGEVQMVHGGMEGSQRYASQGIADSGPHQGVF